MSAPPIADEPAADLFAPARRPRSRRPLRVLLAVAELLAAGFAVWGAFWCWPRGIATITLVLEDGTQLVSTRYFGNWMAAAIGLCVLAGLLVLDAVRHLTKVIRAPS
ncbi:hypothetical protein [Actinophytocola sp.]|uniref:hypothetical protein n=1 Tax=Actinophytocola sp. TaxID=1872138 RepID=UPI002D7FC050|nr:hypothetical protein [Actinophytocola sp.]HET9138685.1 hypothetical protein [Actinophytocola sp.]